MLWEALGFVAEPGRFVISFLLGHPPSPYRTFASSPLGEQSRRQALQFPIFADPAVSLYLSCFMGSNSGTSWKSHLQMQSDQMFVVIGQCHVQQFTCTFGVCPAVPALPSGIKWPEREFRCMRGWGGVTRAAASPSLSPILRLTHLTSLREGRETRFRLLWVCSVVKIFCSLSSLRGLVLFFGGGPGVCVFVVRCSLFVDATFFV